MRIRSLIADLLQAREYALNTPDSDYVVRDCDAALARLRTFLKTIEIAQD